MIIIRQGLISTSQILLSQILKYLFKRRIRRIVSEKIWHRRNVETDIVHMTLLLFEFGILVFFENYKHFKKIFFPKCRENPQHFANSDCSWRIAARKKPQHLSRYYNLSFRPFGIKTQCQLHKNVSKGSRLCVFRLAHLLMTIFSFTTSILISFLHLGQNKGNFTRTVSAYTFVRVFAVANGAMHPH